MSQSEANTRASKHKHRRGRRRFFFLRRTAGGISIPLVSVFSTHPDHRMRLGCALLDGASLGSKTVPSHKE